MAISMFVLQYFRVFAFGINVQGDLSLIIQVYKPPSLIFRSRLGCSYILYKAVFVNKLA